MAKAVIEKREVPQPPKKEEVVVLEMTPSEAEVIVTIARQIGGSLDGPRGGIEMVARALREAGVTHIDGGDELYRTGIRSQALYFKD